MEIHNNPYDLNAEYVSSSSIRIVDTYSNNYAWWRLYSDGWIEQGSRVFSCGNVGNKVVYLLVPMRDTNYSILMNTTDILSGYSSGLNDHTEAAEIGFGALTTTSFRFGVNNGYGSNQMMNWCVRGYKA